MIIVSSRKFRDSQNEYFELAKTDEVILKTLHYGNFRLVPIKETKKSSVKKKGSKKTNDAIYIPNEILKKQSEEIENTNIETTLKNDTEGQEKQQEAIQDTSIIEEKIEIVDEHVENIEPVSKIEEPEVKVQEKEVRVEEPQIIENLEANDNSIEEKKEEEPVEKLIIDERLIANLARLRAEPKATVQIKEERTEPNNTSNIINEQTENQDKTSSQIKTTQKKEAEVKVNETWKPGNVFVDPSLLSLEDVRKQEGLDEDDKKEGFFSKLFKKRK